MEEEIIHAILKRMFFSAKALDRGAWYSQAQVIWEIIDGPGTLDRDAALDLVEVAMATAGWRYDRLSRRWTHS